MDFVRLRKCFAPIYFLFMPTILLILGLEANCVKDFIKMTKYNKANYNSVQHCLIIKVKIIKSAFSYTLHKRPLFEMSVLHEIGTLLKGYTYGLPTSSPGVI